MKKISFLLFFAVLFFTSFSQKNKFHTSYIGITVQPSHYWLYNKDEFTAPDTLFGVKNDSVIVNGLSYGLSYGHFLKKSFGINIGLQYSTQTQYNKFDYNPREVYGNWQSSVNLKYIKLPIFFTGRKELSANKFMTFSAGIQTSFLCFVTEHARVSSKDGYYENTDKGNLIKHNNSYTNDTIAFFLDWRYKLFVFGTNLSVGYEQYINNKLSFNVALNADLDITNTDNTQALFFEYKKDENGNLNRYYPQIKIRWDMYRFGYHSIQYDRKPSHNIHLGMEFGFKYWFGEKALVIERKIPREW